MKIQKLRDTGSLFRLTSEDRDWEKETPETLIWMLQLTILIRQFEQTLLELKEKDLIHGPVHSSIGQEAVAVGVATALRDQDKITSTHRAHHHYLAKVLCAGAEPGFNPLDGLSEVMHEETEVLLAEIMGLAKGCCGGRGGSMHLCHREAGVLGTNAIVAGGVAHAVGAGWADRLQEKDWTSVCFVGDGGLYQGVLHEASNLASLWDTPTIFFVENNQYAVGTPTSQSCSATNLCEVAKAYNMPGACVDGMNPVAVKFAVSEARAGWLPCYIEAQTYRYYHHGGKIPGSAFGYREKAEEAQWRERDPLSILSRQLSELGLLTEEMHETLRANATTCIERAVSNCTASSEKAVVIPAQLWPKAESLKRGLRDDSPLRLSPFVEQEEVECNRELRYSDTIAESIGRWLERDPLTMVLGEEVANMKGGAYGATKGLPKRFPDRVINTPISEAGFCGVAAGAAMNGMHPIVEIMYSSFVLVAADQIFNQIGQLSHIYGGDIDLPLVLRVRVATGFGFGAQHSLDPAAIFHLFPGWQIFAPATPFDYAGLFNIAMNSTRPTAILEHHELYGRTGAVPEGPLDHLVSPRKAKIIRPGRDLTLATYSATTLQALEAANTLAEEGVEAEILDLRTLDRAGTDFETIGQSVEKTGHLLTVEQAPRCGSIGAHIITECLERFPHHLRRPPRSLTGPSAPVPVSKPLEDLCLPDATRIGQFVREWLRP